VSARVVSAAGSLLSPILVGRGMPNLLEGNAARSPVLQARGWWSWPRRLCTSTEQQRYPSRTPRLQPYLAHTRWRLGLGLLVFMGGLPVWYGVPTRKRVVDYLCFNSE